MKSDFNKMQADALSRLLAETATKQDVHDLSSKMDGLETRLRAEIVQATADLRSEISQSIAQTRGDLSGPIGQTGGDLSGPIAQARGKLSGSMAQTSAHLRQIIADGQKQRMRLGAAMIIVMSSVFTFLEFFID